MANQEAESAPLQSKNSGSGGAGGGFLSFLYNKNDGTVLGRTGISWAKIGIFYIIYYICLSAMFAIFLTVFFQTLDDKKPTYTGFDSILKGNPGMGYRPRTSSKSTLIWFKSGIEEDYQEYIDDINEYLEKNYKDKADDQEDCSTMTEPDADKGCYFDYKTHFGSECTKENKWGYSEGQPCILLKLNKIHGWQPDVNGTKTDVQVVCDGENDGDGDNLGEVTYLPAKGFLKGYYPFMGQPNYQAPLVMIKLKDSYKGVLIQVFCRGIADNIESHNVDRTGGTHFEVMID